MRMFGRAFATGRRPRDTLETAMAIEAAGVTRSIHSQSSTRSFKERRGAHFGWGPVMVQGAATSTQMMISHTRFMGDEYPVVDLTDEQHRCVAARFFERLIWVDHEENGVHGHDHGDDISDGHEHGDSVRTTRAVRAIRMRTPCLERVFKTPGPSYTWRANRHSRAGIGARDDAGTLDVNSSASSTCFDRRPTLLRTCNHTVHTGGVLPTPTTGSTCARFFQ